MQFIPANGLPQKPSAFGCKPTLGPGNSIISSFSWADLTAIAFVTLSRWYYVSVFHPTFPFAHWRDDAPANGMVHATENRNVPSWTKTAPFCSESRSARLSGWMESRPSLASISPCIKHVSPFLQHVPTLRFVLGFVIDAP